MKMLTLICHGSSVRCAGLNKVAHQVVFEDVHFFPDKRADQKIQVLLTCRWKQEKAFMISKNNK